MKPDLTEKTVRYALSPANDISVKDTHGFRDGEEYFEVTLQSFYFSHKPYVFYTKSFKTKEEAIEDKKRLLSVFEKALSLSNEENE